MIYSVINILRQFKIVHCPSIKQMGSFKFTANSFPYQCKLRILSCKSLVHTRSHKHNEKSEDMAHVRNIGIMAHIDAGKTTTTERMLYYCGFTKYLGEVDQGSTVTDYLDQERTRGITITSAAVTFHWKNHKINLIDTPGHVDFTIEVERALRVMDGCVAILDASAGVEAQTLTVWRQANHYNIPRIIYLNKMDKQGANTNKCLKSIQDKLHVTPILIQIPIGTERDFRGLVDLVTLEKIVWQDKLGRESLVTLLTKDEDVELWETASKARHLLIGQLADLDDTIADYVLSDACLDKISIDELRLAIRRVTIAEKAVPVCLGSSLKNKGVQTLLDNVTLFLPNPNDRHYSFLQYYNDDLVSLAFKVTHDKFRGEMTFLRVYGGSLRAGANVYNMNRDVSEKVERLMQVNADDYRDVRVIHAGNIACVSGFTQTLSGDTIVDSHTAAEHASELYRKLVKEHSDDTSQNHAVLAGLDVPDPVFFCAIEPPSLAYEKQLQHALDCLQREDPTFKVTKNPDTGQNIISGMGELHLEVIKDRILKEYKVDASLGRMEVSYRETLTSSHEITDSLSQVIGDRHHEVAMKLAVHPMKSRDAFREVELVHSRENTWENVKRAHLQAINRGIASGLSCGPLLSFPLVGVRVCLHDLTVQRGTSVPMVSACASQCLMKLLKSADSVLLEPMMQLQISTDEDHLTTVIGDLSHRRGRIEGISTDHDARIITAVTPLSAMMDYSTTLRTITSGTAHFTMQLGHYEKLTLDQQHKVIERLTGYGGI